MNVDYLRIFAGRRTVLWFQWALGRQIPFGTHVLGLPATCLEERGEEVEIVSYRDVDGGEKKKPVRVQFRVPEIGDTSACL